MYAYSEVWGMGSRARETYLSLSLSPSKPILWQLLFQSYDTRKTKSNTEGNKIRRSPNVLARSPRGRLGDIPALTRTYACVDDSLIV